MKYCWSTITVKSMPESLKFYQDIIGLPLAHKLPGGPGMEIAFLGDGETKVELIFHEAKQNVNFGPDISLGFEVESLEETMSFVKKNGIEILAGPFQPNPSVRFFYILDPNSLKIQFVENIR